MPASLPALPHLPAAPPRSGVSPDARLALRQWLADGERALAAAFHAGGDAAALSRRRAAWVDTLVGHVWRACLGDAPGCTLLAVGGYGRGALFPHSDLDLLVLGEAPELARQARALEALFACLWDVGLRPGHAVRDPAQCRALAASDVSVFTSLLDARALAGDGQVLQPIVDDHALWPAAAFLAAKVAEQAARFARCNDTAYNLEPDLKDGPGGLRTLDLMRWLGRRTAGAGDFDLMVARDLLDATEREALLRAQATLERYRFALHLAAGRAQERLLFDYQRTLATQLGFEDEHADNLGVERFMQAYYRAATIVERLGAQFVERCTELLGPDAAVRELDADFLARGQRIEPRAGTLLVQRPAAVIALFAAQLDHPELHGLTAQAMRLLQQALASHGEAFAEDAAVRDAFLALLRRGAPAVEALARMNRHGVLAALLPAFRRIVGRMQYDLFHVYTVDEHTLRVLRNVASFADAGARERFPEADHVYAELPQPELLLLAALLHDIAKGRGGDHSELGEVEARQFCLQLGLPGHDVELVAWLVRHHLLMSVTAQRQDITDPQVVHRFASAVGDRTRLDYLYLLTMADIAGTNPRLWNGWKARLLADLHVAARYVLRAGLQQPQHAGERIAAKRERALALAREQTQPSAVIVALDDLPDDAFLRFRAEQILFQARAIAGRAEHDVVVAIDSAPARGSSDLFVCAPDRDGLFATIMVTLDRLGISVTRARLLVSPQRRVFDTFEIIDARSLAPLDGERSAALRAALLQALAPRELQPRATRRQLPRRLRHFQSAPHVAFSDGDDATQLALVGSDRPGMLAQIALALREARVRVHDARIATFGERVEDFFTLTDGNGKALDAPAREAVRVALARAFGAPSQ
ncbi:MAG: [protein-PII] uridylyltransferase [Dokdonella sp.]|uniref:[protein-PII] uridylyltransferase n=4 Tax=Dokdonella sp. TaxID=2291710 RepID=UPI0025C267F3|nr:[protein-PII] uridylyltransferase [Dokdonella sp.]MBX3699522.1 [protein-PII] uridylyltransferase [Dokdonella sp.]